MVVGGGQKLTGTTGVAIDKDGALVRGFQVFVSYDEGGFEVDAVEIQRVVDRTVAIVIEVIGVAGNERVAEAVFTVLVSRRPVVLHVFVAVGFQQFVEVVLLPFCVDAEETVGIGPQYEVSAVLRHVAVDAGYGVAGDEDGADRLVFVGAFLARGVVVAVV